MALFTVYYWFDRTLEGFGGEESRPLPEFYCFVGWTTQEELLKTEKGCYWVGMATQSVFFVVGSNSFVEYVRESDGHILGASDNILLVEGKCSDWTEMSSVFF